jgi:hypothetical protein
VETLVSLTYWHLPPNSNPTSMTFLSLKLFAATNTSPCTLKIQGSEASSSYQTLMRPGLSDKDKRRAFKVSGGALNLLNLETIDCPLPNCAIHRSAPALRNLQIIFTTSGGGWVSLCNFLDSSSAHCELRAGPTATAWWY